MLQIQYNYQFLILMMASGLLEINQPISKEDIILSARELEVLSHLARGKAAREIGMLLDISRRTVEHHIENIKHKTNCGSKAELLDMYWSG